MKNEDCKRIANNIDIKIDSLINRVIELAIHYNKKELSNGEIKLLTNNTIKGDRAYTDIKTELFSLGKEL